MYKVAVGEAVKTLFEEIIGYKKQGNKSGMINRLEEMTKNPESIRSAMPKFECDEVLLYVDDDITVYYIATTPKITYPPHEHGMIAISALYKGTETHIFYDRDGQNVKERNHVTFEAPAVVDLTVDTVHAICTNDDEPNESLHFYLGELETKKRTLWDCNGKNPQQYNHQNYLTLSKPFD